ncbi:MAG: hypothetical protein QOG73_1854, partial [Acetobacteraceae bacterium]|nr:hypothetical protein [Acetobacteraceae bacterium]
MKTLTKKRIFLAAALGVAMGFGPASAWAFDLAGFKVRLEATKAEAATKT